MSPASKPGAGSSSSPAKSQPCRRRAEDRATRPAAALTIECGTLAEPGRYVRWAIWSYPVEDATFVSVEATKGRSTVWSGYRIIDAGGHANATTYLNDDDFGPVNVSVVLAWTDGSPAGDTTITGTVDETQQRCQSYPSATFRARCDGQMVVQLFNAATAGVYSGLAVFGNEQFVWSGLVAPSTSQSVTVEAAMANHVVVATRDTNHRVADAYWQQAGCIGPAAAGGSSGGPTVTGTGTGSGSGSTTGLEYNWLRRKANLGHRDRYPIYVRKPNCTWRGGRHPRHINDITGRPRPAPSTDRVHPAGLYCLALAA